MALKSLEEMNSYFEGKKKKLPEEALPQLSKPSLVAPTPEPQSAIPEAAPTMDPSKAKDNNERMGMVLMAALPTVLGGLLGGKTGALAGAKTAESGTKMLWEEKLRSEKDRKEQDLLKLKTLKEQRADERADETLDLKRESNKIAREQKAADKSSRGTEKQIDLVSSLRKERSSLPTTKDTQTMAAAYNKIQTAAAKPSAAGDLSLVFNFMKMQDPGSTVREGEFANAQNAAGVPDRIRNQYNKVISGQILNPTQREDFITQAQGSYESQLALQKQIDQQYSELAKKYNIDPTDVILNFEAQARAPKAPLTKVIGGVKYVQVPGGWEEAD